MERVLWASACHHLGSPSCDLPRLERDIKQAEKEKWDVVLVGDIVDNGVSAGSKHLGLEWSQAVSPMAQIELAYALFSGLARKGQIQAILGGNHAIRTMRVAGNHPEKIVALLLSGTLPPTNIPRAVQLLGLVNELEGSTLEDDKIKRKEVLEDLRRRFLAMGEGTVRSRVPFFAGLGTFPWAGLRVVAHHGVHVRSRDNWNRLERAARGFDLYLTAHNHTLSHEVGCEDIQAKGKLAHFFSVGTYQKWAEYAQVAMYGRKPVGSVLIKAKRGKITGYEFLI